MKKFLIAAVTAIFLALLINTAYYQWGFYIDFRSGEPVRTFTATEGKTILVDTGEGLEPYEIRGVDMGVGIPGHFATEHAIDKETYLRWFKLIKEMGANTIRVYTIQSGEFYEAVYEYNLDNPDPLFILHGVWVNDYVQNSRVDAYDDAFAKAFIRDCRTLVDIIHGRKKVNLGYGTTNTSGVYTRDVSRWVLGYIIGVEWEDVTVAYTDHMKPERNSYKGRYMYTSEDATPFEAMLAKAGDSLIAYETDKYKEQRLVAFSNWPTTDPFSYPEFVLRLFRKCASVDVEHIKTTKEFLSGQFASYHIYPYYPDYLSYFEDWKSLLPFREKYKMEDGTYNTYATYLELLNHHHTMPVIISEFGVPASRGRAQADFNTGYSQGFMTEHEQGEAIVSGYHDIMRAGSAGCVIFTWQDEWFKRTWNTMAGADLRHTAYWSDYQTNEQFFGLLSFDPGWGKSVCYTDGDTSEWSEDDLVSAGKDYKLYMKYDEKFLYFRIYSRGEELGNKKLYIPIDVTPRSGSYYAAGEDVKFSMPSDFLVILEGEENSRVLVQKRYDAFSVVYAESFGQLNPQMEPPDTDTPEFVNIYMALQVALEDPELREDVTGWKPQKFETGKLTMGNGNPLSPDYNSISDYIINGRELELRLPWGLLNFSDPSNMQIHDDYFDNYGIENMGISEIYAGVGAAGEGRIEMGSFPLKGWGKKPTYHERLKKSYYMVQEMWTADEE